MYVRILMLVVILGLMVSPVLAQEGEGPNKSSGIARVVTGLVELEASERWCGDRFLVGPTHLKFIYHEPGEDRGGPWFIWRFSIVSMVRDDTRPMPTTKRFPGRLEIRLSQEEYDRSGGEGCLGIPLQGQG